MEKSTHTIPGPWSCTRFRVCPSTANLLFPCAPFSFVIIPCVLFAQGLLVVWQRVFIDCRLLAPLDRPVGVTNDQQRLDFRPVCGRFDRTRQRRYLEAALETNGVPGAIMCSPSLKTQPSPDDSGARASSPLVRKRARWLLSGFVRSWKTWKSHGILKW